MVSKKDVFIKIERIKEIIQTLEDIDKTNKEIELLIRDIDNLSAMEQKILENWGNYLEDINLKLEQVGH